MSEVASPARDGSIGTVRNGARRPPGHGTPRRILIVHNRYQMRGGEDAAVEREAAALVRAGQRVETLFFSNDSIRTGADRLRTALEAGGAPRGVAAVLDAARRFRPDIVHVHNWFPLVSPAVHPALRATGVATVQTLHNYRVTCASATLMREGAPCEECVTGTPYRAVLHGCYRGSRAGSLAVARMIDRHRRAGTFVRDVDRLIALTDFAAGRFVAAGLPAARLRVKPNGLPDPGPPDGRPRAGLLYVGRLSAEKGLAVLAAAAALGGLSVDVIGEGPLSGPLAGAPGLNLVGAREPEAVRAAMARAAAVVVPSLWYEGLPMVIAEAFAAGTPVVASRIGALAEIVEDGVTGLHAAAGDAADLARVLARVGAEPEAALRMGRAARAAYEARWTEAATTSALLSIYDEAAASRAETEVAR